MKIRPKMIRTQICLTPKQKIKLQREANKKGIPCAELIRRILDDHIIKGE